MLTAVALSLCFHYIPGLNTVSPGFVIIICGVAAAVLLAWRGRSLLTVAVAACCAVALAQGFLLLF